jgi:hypothetical protein
LQLDPEATVIPGQLTFSFEMAKSHLIAADNRFMAMFDNVPCHPFETPEAVDPFK